LREREGCAFKKTETWNSKPFYGNIVERGLRAYQVTANKQTDVPCRMVVDGQMIRFDAGRYDPSKPLIIDPLIFSTYPVAGTHDYGRLSNLQDYQ